MAHPSTHHRTGLADPRDNLVLADVSDAVYARLASALQPVVLRAGERLDGDALEQERRFYFIGRGIVSLLYTTFDGESAEMAIVGREGGVDLGRVFGAHAMPGERVVQASGCGWAIEPEALRREFTRGGALQDALLAFSQALMVQAAQTAVCNRHHGVEKQFIRWALLSLDRLAGSDLAMTQDSIARMLGVRRAGITEAAGRLRREGLLELERGHVRVNDRAALEARACECYSVIRDQYERVLPGLQRVPASR